MYEETKKKLPLQTNHVSKASPGDNSNTKSLINISKPSREENSEVGIVKASVDAEELLDIHPDNVDEVVTLKETIFQFLMVVSIGNHTEFMEKISAHPISTNQTHKLVLDTGKRVQIPTARNTSRIK